MNRIVLEKLMLTADSTIKDAIETLTHHEVGMILVVDDEQRLIGVVVDSDIRRGFLEGCNMNSSLADVMNESPYTLPAKVSNEELKKEFKRYPRSCIPLVDEEGRVCDLALLSDHFAVDGRKDNFVVLMAGGFGKRLQPLTDNLPKPMVKVGGKPILELLVRHLSRQGFWRFIMVINHFGDQIRTYFGNGHRWNVDIEYVEEGKMMGTAGGLSLIEKELEEPFIVMNADLLTNVDCQSLIDFHVMEKGKATVCVREYNIQIPFGVVQVEEGRLVSMDEKPLQRFFVNAGIYVFEPDVLKLVKEYEAADMPDVLQRVNTRYPGAIACFPITEYWLDIGRIDDYEKAQKEYEKVFKK
ncbi:MAG: nucleotidyltransferase family protein [Deltaproteobacteria bacterium]|nr:nucleotidyltransferase family protein [Deltaproteobacteria bacterium]MBW2063923.1 nucleotidyltransferase family protein [Deltaproteobacteria bacterium]